MASVGISGCVTSTIGLRVGLISDKPSVYRTRRKQDTAVATYANLMTVKAIYSSVRKCFSLESPVTFKKTHMSLHLPQKIPTRVPTHKHKKSLDHENNNAQASCVQLHATTCGIFIQLDILIPCLLMH